MVPPLVKICGLTRSEDAVLAFTLGARFGGVIGMAGSPRFVEPGSLAESAVLAGIPCGGRVWVSVEPSISEMELAFERGFDRVQIHFDPAGDFDPFTPSSHFGAERIWLAPRMREPEEFCPDWLGMAGVFLVDGFSVDRFGGTGKRVNARGFARLASAHPSASFALAGGLAPDNVDEAIRQSGARRIDVNSGVEQSPGVKDSKQLEKLFTILDSL